MFDVLAKSSARAVLAALLGMGGAGLAISHSSDVQFGSAIEVDAPSPDSGQTATGISGTVDGQAGSGARAASDAGQTASDAATSASASADTTVNGIVSSLPPAPPQPTTPPTQTSPPTPNPSPQPTPAPAEPPSGVYLLLRGSADVTGTARAELGGSHADVDGNAWGYGRLDISLGS